MRGRLVEIDADNVLACRSALASASLSAIEVAQGDAGFSDAFIGAVPAEVVLLCGILGNISEGDIENTIHKASQLCAPGAMVLWTRHRRSPDLVPTIRGWFRESGFKEMYLDSVADDSFAVGMNQLDVEPQPLSMGTRLFSFI